MVFAGGNGGNREKTSVFSVCSCSIRSGDNKLAARSKSCEQRRHVSGDQGGDGARLTGSETILRFKQRAFSVEYAGLLLRYFAMGCPGWIDRDCFRHAEQFND